MKFSEILNERSEDYLSVDPKIKSKFKSKVTSIFNRVMKEYPGKNVQIKFVSGDASYIATINNKTVAFTSDMTTSFNEKEIEAKIKASI